jgi:hypothetical protein
MVACLINPWMHRALVLPMEAGYFFKSVLADPLATAGRAVGKIQETDPSFLVQLSPFSSDYWTRPSLGQNAAGLAYFLLLLTGIVSFLLLFLRKGQRGRVNATRLVVFLVFGVCSAASFRLIPFFAVVAGPIVALNFQDYWAQRKSTSASLTRVDFNRLLCLRLGALAAGVVLLLLAWPGWLHSQADSWRATRHVAWGVSEDPGVVQAVSTIRQVQQKTGLCKLGFNYSLDGGNLFDWFTFRTEPTVKLYCDGRYDMPAAQAEAFGKIRRALREEAQATLNPPKDPLLRVTRIQQARKQYQLTMRENGLDYVVLTAVHQDPQVHAIATLMFADIGQWVLLYHDGRTAVFGWIDSAARSKGEAYRPFRLNLDTLAVPATPPPNVPRVVLDASRVPPSPKPARDEWQTYLLGPAQPAWSSSQSAQFFEFYKFGLDNWHNGHMDLVFAVAGTHSALAEAEKVMGGLFKTQKNPQGQTVREPIFRAVDIGPPGAAILAVRAARNATLECPDDITAYSWLGTAYQMLTDMQEQHWARRPMAWEGMAYRWNLRLQLRLMQILTALHNAAAIQPDNWRIHKAIHEVYARMQYYDLALDHLLMASKALESRKTDRGDAGEAERFKQVLPKLIEGWTNLVATSRKDYERATSSNMDVLEKFHHALFEHSTDKQGREQIVPRRLVNLGLTLLREAKVDSFRDDPGKLRFFASWQLYLLLTTGHAREARTALEDEKLRQLLGGGDFEQMRALAAAALGDYRNADKYLAEAEKVRGLASDSEILKQQTQDTQTMARQLASAGGSLPAGDGFLGPLVRMAVLHAGQQETFAALTRLWKERREAAEIRLLRGLLALETGDNAAAVTHFSNTLEILPVTVHFPDRPIAQRYLELLQGR